MKFSEIIHNEELQQFQMNVDGAIAIVDYKNRNGKFYLVHSEVPYPMRGRGAGKVLVEKTYDYLEEHGIASVAVCSFIAAVEKRRFD